MARLSFPCTVELLLILIWINTACCQPPEESILFIQPRLHKLKREQCFFEGNPDIYGLGIRIGYYTQACSVWFANFFVLHEAKVLRAVNTLFMFAIFVGLMFLSHEPSSIFAAEAFLLIHITFATWYIGAVDVSRYSKRHWQFSFERTIIRDGTFIGMAVYNVWFWWTGLQIMRETPCGTFVFFFAKVNLYGWYRKANLVLAILAICSNVLIECGSFLRLVRHFLARKIRSTEYQERLMGKLQEGIDDERPCLRINGMNQDFPLLDDHNPSVTMPKNKTNKRTCKGSQSHKQDDTLLLTRTATMPSLPSWTVRSPLRTTSFHSDLTNSESPPTANTAPQSDNKNSQLPNFQQLYIADKYVAEVFAAHSFAITQRKHFKIVLLPGHLDVYIPYFRPSFNHDAVSLHTCIITAVTAVRRRRLNPLALIVLFLYIYETRTQPFYRYPWLLHCALTQPSHAEQDWRTLTTVTDILVSREPDEVRKWYWIPSAVQSGLVSVGLVLSIELTISWNRITNVNNIRTVGQLIPFILGCGGLIKVLWAKLRMSWHSTGQEAGENDLGPAEVGLADVYDKRKERYERSLGIRLHREPGSEEIV